MQMLTALVLPCSIGTTDRRQLAQALDQTELPFMCVTYGIKTATKNSLPEGKHVTTAYVRKSQIIP